MYFAILGKNPEISKVELQLIQPKNISSPKKGILVFDTDFAEKISTLGGIIKAGSVVKEKDLPEVLKDVKIIWIKEIANGKHLKQTMGIKRFKTVDFFHTDKEIKEKWLELINLGNGDYGVVEQYQNIPLYETIDFEKPARSMQMGMMPAKLTHMMINIWLHQLAQSATDIVIYDPFAWSGTTGFLANALGFDFIGSDINISYIEQNAKRRGKTPFSNANNFFHIFQHDIFQERKPSQPEEVFDGVLPQLIVTEGRLGPIINATTKGKDISKAQMEVVQFYEAFIDQIHTLFYYHKEKPVIVFTIPVYKGTNLVEDMLTQLIGKRSKMRQIQSIPEIYQRENQNIGRKIIIIKQI